MREYNATHPRPDRSAYKSAYDRAHKEEIATYALTNRDRLSAKAKAYYAANRERILARVKARSEAKREEILAYHTAYYASNTSKIKANVAAYRAANPDKKRHLENKRRARKAGNGGSHTLAQRLAKFSALGNVCFYCLRNAPLTVDHDVPLKRGGTDDITNVLPACRSCNSRKNARTAQEFIKWLSRANHAAIGGVGSKPSQKYEGR